MSKLQDLIAELCPDGVEWKTLGEVGDIRDGTHDSPKKQIEGKYLVTSKNIKYGGIDLSTAYFISEKDYLDINKRSQVDKNDILISMIGTIGEIAFINEEPNYAIKNVGLIKKLQGGSCKFIYYFLQSKFAKEYIEKNISKGSQSFLSLGKLRKFPIPLPPLPIQEEIVRILDNFNANQTELMNQFQSELKARKQQYEYYRDSLLTFGDDIELKPLGEIATEMYRGSGIKRDQITAKGIPCVRYGEIYTTYKIWFDECVSHTIEENISNRKYFEYGDIIFAITGESIEDIAKSSVYLGQEKCLAGGDTVIMKHNENPKFLSYALSTNDAKNQKGKGKVKSKVVHSSVPALKEIKIPIPPIPEQDRIVAILDNLDNQITEITQKLSEEISARKQQYEYYRDTLLTFKEVNNERI